MTDENTETTAESAPTLPEGIATQQPPLGQTLSQDEFQKLAEAAREEAHKALISWGTIKGALTAFNRELKDEIAHVESLIKSKF